MRDINEAEACLSVWRATEGSRIDVLRVSFNIGKRVMMAVKDEFALIRRDRDL